jgi:hypothetical protein
MRAGPMMPRNTGRPGGNAFAFCVLPGYGSCCRSSRCEAARVLLSCLVTRAIVQCNHEKFHRGNPAPASLPQDDSPGKGKDVLRISPPPGRAGLRIPSVRENGSQRQKKKVVYDAKPACPLHRSAGTTRKKPFLFEGLFSCFTLSGTGSEATSIPCFPA